MLLLRTLLNLVFELERNYINQDETGLLLPLLTTYIYYNQSHALLSTLRHHSVMERALLPTLRHRSVMERGEFVTLPPL